MKSISLTSVLAWSIFAALLSGLALPAFQVQFSEKQFYFVFLQPPQKLTGSKEDNEARKLLAEASRRGLIDENFMRELKRDNAIGGVHIERMVVQPTFYWLYTLFTLTIWGVPIIVAFIWKSSLSKTGAGRTAT